MPTLNDELKKLDKKQYPRSNYQKRYARTFTYNGNSITHFPGKIHNDIPNNYFKDKLFIKPTNEQLKIYEDIYKLTKTVTTFFNTVDDFIVLSGIDKETVLKHLVYLHTINKARFNVDRWGRITFVSLLIANNNMEC